MGSIARGPRDGDALLLATGELRGVLLRLRAHADPVEQGTGPLLGCLLVLLADLDLAQRHVLEHGLVREEVEGLEDHPDVGPQPGELLALMGQGLAVDRDRTGVDRLQAVDGAAQGGLPGPGGSDDHDDFAAGDRQVDVLEYVQRAEVLVDILQDDQVAGCGHTFLGHRYFGHRSQAPSSSVSEDSSDPPDLRHYI
ncbi:hypothetical protein RKD26_001626 [Streptomyces calvus]